MSKLFRVRLALNNSALLGFRATERRAAAFSPILRTGLYVLSCLTLLICVSGSLLAAESASSGEALARARVHEKGRRFNDAAAILEKLLVAEDPQIRNEARYRLACCLAQSGDDQAAAKKLEPLLNAKGGVWGGRACGLSADIEERNGRPDGAIRALQLLIAHYATDFSRAQAALRCGRLLTNAQRFDEAKNTLLLGLQNLKRSSELEFPEGQKLLKAFQSALAALDKAREIHKRGLATILWEQASRAYFQRKYNTAGDRCRRMRKLKDMPQWIAEGVDALELALRWREARQPQEKWALQKDFQRLLSESPSGTFRGHLALLQGDWLLMRQYRLKEASALFFAVEKPLRSGVKGLKHPGWSESIEPLWMRIGFCHYMNRKFDEAADAFADGLALRPEKAKAKAGVPPGFQNLMEMCRQRRTATPEPLLTHGTDRGRILTAMADAYFVADRYGEAKGIYQQFRNDPGFRSEYHGHRSHAQFMEARCLYQELETPRALRLLADFGGRYRSAPEAPAALLRFAVFMNTHQQIDPRNKQRYELLLAKKKGGQDKGPEAQPGEKVKSAGRARLRKYPREWVDRDVINALLAVRRAFPGTEEAQMAVVQLGAKHKWRGEFKKALGYFQEARQLLARDPRWVKYLDESCITPLLSRLEQKERP